MKEIPEDVKFFLDCTSADRMQDLIERYETLKEGAHLMDEGASVGGPVYVSVSAHDLKALCHYAVQYMKHMLELKEDYEDDRQ